MLIFDGVVSSFKIREVASEPVFQGASLTQGASPAQGASHNIMAS